ncbi:MAG: dynamin family protein, partial [Planktothrix sp.]
DFKLGDESLVIEALAQEVDFILFIRKPSKDRANFEQNDAQLYDLANQALNDLPSRSIFVLNADRNGENQENCRSLKRDIDLGKVQMPVLDWVIADCSSPEEANSKVLQVVLNNLRSNVTQLDRKYAEQKIADLQASLIELKQQLQLALRILPDIDEHEIANEYDDLFDEFWDKITNEMTALQKELIKTREYPDENLKSQIEDVLKDCQENVEMPTIEEVEKRRNKLESYASTYSEYLIEMRTNLSRKFLDMDKGLKKTIEGTKAKVADVLVEKCDLGGLAKVSRSEFLAEVATQIPPDYTELKKGFEILSGFNLSYRGLIQHRIRLQLDPLTPDKTAGLKTEGANAQDILDHLHELYQETLYNCGNALNGFLSEPSQASFAIVEEFADRVLRAKSAKKEWKRFLRPKRGQIWENFDKLQKQIDASQEWSKLLDSVSSQIDDLEGSLKTL